MDFDDQLRRYFGTDDLSTIAPSTLETGLDRIRVDLGMEKDRARRFALWCLLYMFNASPDLDVAFDNEEDRNFARDFMDMMAKAQESD
ncbi:hypothetical protein EDF56_1011079 [Novosphingobium sp. PhB165]|uniref:hypothetical protein n=1 Tax=Novosphingobium sp. PhB165 TaxID=2485105 RepID=UPI00104C9D30|nr:hypothetical protein [Novosphingobium sp. PhB165]TCM22389.1 hypothetical protein EDF56_1011079 [Novosphingobium sp. PhB165]